MKTIFTLRSIFLTLWLIGLAANCAALSIGQISGAAVIGRPLELSAPIQFDGPRDSDSSCVNAELLYGDARVDRSKVHLSVTGGTGGQPSVVHIVSSAVLNEPVVNLVIRAGCGQASSRRYVILADGPREALAPNSLAPAMALLATEPAALSAVAPTTPRRRKIAATSAEASLEAVKARATSVSLVRTASAASKERHSNGHLQLDVWEPSLDRSPWLRVSSELLTSPSSDGAQRAAAAALWQALTAQPQDLLRTAERLRLLEGEVAALRGLSGRHRAEIAGVRDTLSKAESRRYTDLLLPAGLLLVAGCATVFFLYRANRAHSVQGRAWYPEGPAETPRPHEEANSRPDDAGVSSILPTVAPQDQNESPAARPPVSAVPSDTFTFPPLEIKSAAPLRGRGGPEKRPGMKVEALQAAQQQAEFFASLGQHDEAIEVLGAYIEESSESAALAYLELFRMYQALDMREESSQLETEIRRVYGIPVGALNQHLEHPRELESYPSAISRITASWPTAEGLSIIEDLLFRRPSGERELLSAEAYRELLWLYALGQEIVHRTGMPAGLQLLGDSRLPNDHFIMPWAPVEEVPLELSMETLNAIDVAQASTGFGVDVDLTDVPGDVFEQGRQHAHQRSIPVQPAPAEVIDLFDAAMESQSRKLFVHR